MGIRAALTRHTPDEALRWYLRCLQRRRGIKYIAVGSFIGFFVGYYALPRLHWFYGIVGMLSFAVGVQLSFLRQHRRTWQSERLVKLVDAIERIAIGMTILVLDVYVILSGTSPEDFIAIGVWCAFFILSGTALGEYWWQQRRFFALDRSAQLRYLCTTTRQRYSK